MRKDTTMWEIAFVVVLIWAFIITIDVVRLRKDVKQLANAGELLTKGNLELLKVVRGLEASKKETED